MPLGAEATAACRQLRICHVITGFDTGGAERVLLRTVQRLDPKRFSSLVLSLRAPGQLSPRADKSGVETIHLGVRARPGLFTVVRLARVFRHRKVDVVHGYLYDASIATRLAGRIAQVPVVVTSTRASLSYLPRAAWWLDRVTARWCHKVIAVSRGTADFVIEQERIGRDKVVVIPNGVDLEQFQPGDRSEARDALGVSANAFVVACVGRLHSQKGHRYLFEALAAVHSQIPELVCLVAGDGPLREKLENHARHVGLGSVCRFLGIQDPVQPVYDAADVTVLPSLYEGMPNVVLEAMAMGCPVIATAVEGSVDLVRSGVTGFLVPPADPAAMGRALLELEVDPKRRASMRVVSRMIAERAYGIERMIGTLETLYTSEWEKAMRRLEAR